MEKNWNLYKLFRVRFVTNFRRDMEKQVWKRSPIKADGHVVKAVIKTTPITPSIASTPAVAVIACNIVNSTPLQIKTVVSSKTEERSGGTDRKLAFDNNLKASLGALYDITSPIKNNKNDMTLTSSPVSSPMSSPVTSTKSSTKSSPVLSASSSPKNKGHSPTRSKHNDGTKIAPMHQSPSPYSSPSNNHFLASAHMSNVFDVSNFPAISTKIDELHQVEPQYYYEFLNNVNNQLAALGLEVSKHEEHQILSEEEGNLLLQSCIKCHQEFVRQGMFL